MEVDGMFPLVFPVGVSLDLSTLYWSETSYRSATECRLACRSNMDVLFLLYKIIQIKFSVFLFFW